MVVTYGRNIQDQAGWPNAKKCRCYPAEYPVVTSGIRPDTGYKKRSVYDPTGCPVHPYTVYIARTVRIINQPSNTRWVKNESFLFVKIFTPRLYSAEFNGFLLLSGGGGNGSQLSLDRDKSFSTLIWNRGRDKSGSGSREVMPSQGQEAEVRMWLFSLTEKQERSNTQPLHSSRKS